MTAFFAPPPENRPTADGFHSSTKTVFVLTLAIARLVRSFHIIRQEKAGKDTKRVSKRQNRKGNKK
jgi:hypothetical protein|tara:strand:- start:552 stop:749 length:198 start_codon:yes stop_codon:yes gene_type:complete